MISAAVPATFKGGAIRPACPISCCNNSVALRTLECISVRFVIVPCVFIIRMVPYITMAPTPSSTAIATIVSSNENPAWNFFVLFIVMCSGCAINSPQNGDDFSDTTVAFGGNTCGPTPLRTWHFTEICLSPVVPAGTLICQTRMYCQPALAATGLPFPST